MSCISYTYGLHHDTHKSLVAKILFLILITFLMNIKILLFLFSPFLLLFFHYLYSLSLLLFLSLSYFLLPICVFLIFPHYLVFPDKCQLYSVSPPAICIVSGQCGAVQGLPTQRLEVSVSQDLARLGFANSISSRKRCSAPENISTCLLLITFVYHFDYVLVHF